MDNQGMSIDRVPAFAVATVFAACVGVGAQLTVKQTAPIDAEALLHTVRTLSSAEFEGRRTGTPGNARARAWIIERFQEARLLPPGDNFRAPFKFTRLSKSSGQGNSVTGEGVNIVGTCRGSKPGGQGSDASVMVITAH